ncbi:MAG: efflux RND transporter periplasmic adaptor subunit [Caldilineaceae bacterium]|nr:efflux RND transporter periplasmic adaptor subunit [Caldilineaceae bacterium]
MNSRNFLRSQPYRLGAKKRASLACSLIALSLFLTACNFTAAQPTSVPFEATPYEPGGTVVAPAESTPAAEGVTATTASTDTTTTTAAPASLAAAQPTATTASAASLSTANALRYSGEIAAESQVVIVAETAGMVLALPLQMGDIVQKGDLVAQLDTTLLEAQSAQAMAGLEAANAQLALAQMPADPDDLAAAQAGVNAASAAYQRATAGLTAEEQRLVLAQLKQAQAAVTVAQAAYNQVKGNPAIGMLPQSLQLQQATLAVEAAQAQYDKAMLGATDDVIAGAYAQLAAARAQLQRLREGAKPEQIRAVEAQVKQAEMGVYLAQLQISKATVKAAVAGVVTRVNSSVGSMAAPGAPLVTLLSPEVKVTIAVEETRLSQLAVGQPAVIYVDAYPGQQFAGTVTIIAPELDPATRTVRVTVEPNEVTSQLLPGMSATVDLLVQ